ncbi:MAG TPA: cell division protein ZapA [Gammaproteobacteria bacterium]|nr:cell division protein ZapA [Gammaproteobacteria bacterium]
MSEDMQRVTVRLLDKEYQIACPEDEREALLESADLLNRKMREIRDSGKVVGVDRIAVMAALNMTHEMLEGRSVTLQSDERLLGRIRILNDALAGALGAPH